MRTVDVGVLGAGRVCILVVAGVAFVSANHFKYFEIFARCGVCQVGCMGPCGF